jgi:hypothetical protein
MAFLLRCLFLCSLLQVLPAAALPTSAGRGEVSGRTDDEASLAKSERLGPAGVEASAIDGPGVLGLLTALSVSFVYARRTRRPR